MRCTCLLLTHRGHFDARPTSNSITTGCSFKPFDLGERTMLTLVGSMHASSACHSWGGKKGQGLLLAQSRPQLDSRSGQIVCVDSPIENEPSFLNFCSWNE
jgi:hypothetical protein